MDWLIRFALNNRAVVTAAALFLLIYGVWVGSNLPVDVFPDLSAPTVTVVTEAHGMTPVDLEQQVTFPIETALNGASAVRRIRSATGVGISVVGVEFEWDTARRVARRVGSERLDAAVVRDDVESIALAQVVQYEPQRLLGLLDLLSTHAARSIDDERDGGRAVRRWRRDGYVRSGLNPCE